MLQVGTQFPNGRTAGGTPAGRVYNPDGTFKHVVNNFRAPSGSTITPDGRLNVPNLPGTTNPNTGGMITKTMGGIAPTAVPGGTVLYDTNIFRRPQDLSQYNQPILKGTTGGAPAPQPANSFSQPGLGTYQTGITAGQLPQSSIDNALGRLGSGSAIAPQIYGTATNAQQRGEMGTMLQDSLRAGSWAQKGDLSRDAAYQQAQMQLAFDRARSDAASGGFGNLFQQESDRIGNNMARQSMLLNLLGSLGLGF